MDVTTILSIAQIIVAVSLIVTILLQSRGEGLGSLFGGGGEVFRSRRGLESMLLYLTIILTVLLVVLSITNVWIS